MRTILGNLRPEEIKRCLINFLQSQRTLLICASAVLLALGVGAYGLSLRGGVSDTDKANDLAKIERAVIVSLNKNNHLPESLHLGYLGLNNLKGSIDDYSYNPDSHEDGSPTWSYTTCATFHTLTIKLPISSDAEGVTTGGTGAQAYTAHRKGKQCFGNSYYKDSSHIGLIYNSGEVTAPKVSLNDEKIGDFVSESSGYYLAQREALGSSGSESDLHKNCIKTKPQNTLYKDPFGNLYSCKAFYDSAVPVAGNESHITSLIDAFVNTAKREQFGVHDTTYPANATNANSSPYRLVEGFGGGQFGCGFDTTYYMKIPQTEIEYRYACTLSDLKNLPSGFTVVSELTGP